MYISAEQTKVYNMSDIICLISIHTHFLFKRTSVLREGQATVCKAIQLSSLWFPGRWWCYIVHRNLSKIGQLCCFFDEVVSPSSYFLILWWQVWGEKPQVKNRVEWEKVERLFGWCQDTSPMRLIAYFVLWGRKKSLDLATGIGFLLHTANNNLNWYAQITGSSIPFRSNDPAWGAPSLGSYSIKSSLFFSISISTFFSGILSVLSPNIYHSVRKLSSISYISNFFHTC